MKAVALPEQINLIVKMDIRTVLNSINEDTIVDHYGEKALLEAMDEKEIIKFVNNLSYSSHWSG